MFFRSVIFLGLAVSVFADFPVANDQNCQNNTKFVVDKNSPFVKLCRVANFAGTEIRQSRIVGCLSSDGTEIAMGKTYDQYYGTSKQTGYRIACKKTEDGNREYYNVGPESCLMNQKNVAFGGEAVIGQSLCQCIKTTDNQININCKPLNIWDDKK